MPRCHLSTVIVNSSYLYWHLSNCRAQKWLFCLFFVRRSSWSFLERCKPINRKSLLNIVNSVTDEVLIDKKWENTPTGGTGKWFLSLNNTYHVSLRTCGYFVAAASIFDLTVFLKVSKLILNFCPLSLSSIECLLVLFKPLNLASHNVKVLCSYL